MKEQYKNKQENNTWWLWFAVLETEDMDVLLFSNLLRSTAKYPFHIDEDKGEFEVSAGKIKHCSKVISNTHLQAFIKEIDENSILKFELLDSSLNQEFPITATREIINSTFGKTVVLIKTYYTTPDIALWENNLDDLKTILLMLTKELNLPFNEDYSRKFGNFEIHDTSIAMDSSISIELLNSKRSGTGGAYIRVGRKAPLKDEVQHLHVICREKKDVIFHKLIVLESGQDIIELEELPEDSYELECWVFNNMGELIFQDHQYYIAKFGMNMGVVGRQVNLQDKLSERAQNINRKLGKKASTVTRTNTERSMIQASVREYEQFNDQMMQIQSDLFTSQGDDRWFGKSVECEIEVIEYFQNLLSGGKTKKAILVDPFFGAEAFERLVTRIEETNFELVVLTSLSDINPDTGEKFSIGSDPIELLKKSINKVKDIVNCKLKLINVNRGSSKQAFHDRYLVVEPFEGLPAVYMLSNSVNKMSGNWPFCMSKLEHAIARRVREYIELLCEGKDNSRDGDPNITYEWPENEKPSN
ncbi:MAG: hypothetical protein KAT25_03765 [Sulfuriflexus sp.]|nr:hypothetical protein [Sulfuriflexus sp.]